MTRKEFTGVFIESGRYQYRSLLLLEIYGVFKRGIFGVVGHVAETRLCGIPLKMYHIRYREYLSEDIKNGTRKFGLIKT
jgi:hypothetical protein